MLNKFNNTPIIASSPGVRFPPIGHISYSPLGRRRRESPVFNPCFTLVLVLHFSHQLFVSSDTFKHLMLLSSLSIVGRLFQLSLVAHLQLTAVNCNLGGLVSTMSPPSTLNLSTKYFGTCSLITFHICSSEWYLVSSLTFSQLH